MKKIIYILMTLQLIILSIFAIELLKTEKLNSILYYNKTNIVLSFDQPRKYSKDSGNYMNILAKKYNVIISKYVNKDDGNLIIYTTNSNLGKQIKLTSGDFPKKNSEDFISNIYTKDKNQTGKFVKIDPNINIIIKNIDRTNNYDDAGLYYISTQNETVLKNIVNDLNSDVANTYISEINPRQYSNIDDISLKSFSINTMLICLCFLLTLIHYTINKSREISILKINGYTSLKIINIIIIKMIKIMVLSAITSYVICSIYYIKNNNFNNFRLLSLYFLIISILSIAIYIFFLFITLIILLKNLDVIQAIKGKKNYTILTILNIFLKSIFIIVILCAINTSLNDSKEVDLKLNSLSEWEKAKNFYFMPLIDNGENDDKKHFETSNKLKKFYIELCNQKEAFIADFRNYKKSLTGQYFYEMNTESIDSIPEISPNGKTVTISKNYLKFNPIYSVKSSVLNQIIYDDNTMNILVPEALKSYEKEIYKNFLDYFYFRKIKVENIYNKSLGKPLNITDISTLKINIIYIKNNQSYFTYDAYIEPNKKNLVYDPIAIIDTINIDSSYYLSYMSSCVYFYSNKNDVFGNVLPLIIQFDLTKSFDQAMSIYNSYGNEIQELQREKRQLIIFTIILFLSDLVLTYNLIAIYYEKNKYKLYVKKLFGYSSFDKNIRFIISLILINLLPVLIVTYLYGTQIFIIGLMLLVIECVITFAMEKILSIKSFNSIIKGEH